MKVALVQMKVVERDKEANVKHGLELLSSINQAVDVAILPEMWTTGYSIGKLSEQAEKIDGDVAKQVAMLAKAKNMYIVAGSMATDIEGKFYNTTLVFSPKGELIDTYSKVHLFSLFNEQDIVSAGNERKVVDIAGVPAGLAICYDLRFPEFARGMALDGAKILYLPAEWPSVRGYAWELLSKASAAFNQMYVCAVNCAGEFKGQEFYGHSMVVSPMGEVIAMAGTQEEILYVEFDIAAVDKARATMSMLQDLRWDVYN